MNARCRKSLEELIATATELGVPWFSAGNAIAVRVENGGMPRQRDLLEISQRTMSESLTRKLPTTLPALHRALNFNPKNVSPGKWPGAWSRTCQELATKLSRYHGVAPAAALSLAVWVMRDLGPFIQAKPDGKERERCYRIYVVTGL